jgi:septal ring factor EnvC (AmiA/AmiB activator)
MKKTRKKKTPVLNPREASLCEMVAFQKAKIEELSAKLKERYEPQRLVTLEREIVALEREIKELRLSNKRLGEQLSAAGEQLAAARASETKYQELVAALGVLKLNQ